MIIENEESLIAVICSLLKRGQDRGRTPRVGFRVVEGGGSSCARWNLVLMARYLATSGSFWLPFVYHNTG